MGVGKAHQAIRTTCDPIRFIFAEQHRHAGDELSTDESPSIGANYREANRAVSRADYLNKIGVAGKEAAETQYWFEFYEEGDIGDVSERGWFLQESGELLAIFTRTGKTTKNRG